MLDYIMNIKLILDISPELGVPCVRVNNTDCIIHLQDYEIPEEHLPYITMRGGVFNAYLHKNFRDGTSMSAELFYHYIPEWNTVNSVVERMGYVWTEDDHNGFLNAIDWFSSKPGFVVTWHFDI